MNSAYGNTRLARRLMRLALIASGLVLFMALCGLCAQTANLLWLVMLMLAGDVGVAVYAVKQGLLFEWSLERTWNAVCGGIGFSAEVRSMRMGLKGYYSSNPPMKTIYPRLRDAYGTHDGWTGIVIPFAGQTVEDYTKHADAFTLAFHVPFVTFGIAENGLISVQAGQVPIPAAYDHPAQLVTRQDDMHTRLLSAVVPALAYELELLRNVPMARDLSDRDWYMPIEGQHVLIAARTGGGKGSWIWSLVLGLAPAWRAGLVKFWGCDPKRLELAIGRDWWAHYADNEEDIVKMLEQCVQEMLERAGRLQGKARKFTPSVDTPLNVVVVDELGYLSALLPDRKLRDRAEKAVATILALGRAVGYSLVGAVQDPRKETVGFRDLFPIRIAGGLPEPMVDLVLGEGMHDAGALCEQIPLGNAGGAGVGYVISETSLKPLCVRAAWCSDEVIQQALAAGGQAEGGGFSGQLAWSD